MHNFVHCMFILNRSCKRPFSHVTLCAVTAKQKGADLNVQSIFDKIRVAVFKNRVRTIEFFRDYDKLRSGIITEHQFVCGISLAIGKEAQLSRPEIQKIVEFYRVDEGRVAYKEFCDMMENGGMLYCLRNLAVLFRSVDIQHTCVHHCCFGRVCGFHSGASSFIAAFNVPDLVKKPTQTVVRPPKGALGRVSLPAIVAKILRVLCTECGEINTIVVT